MLNDGTHPLISPREHVTFEPMRAGISMPNSSFMYARLPGYALSSRYWSFRSRRVFVSIVVQGTYVHTKFCSADQEGYSSTRPDCRLDLRSTAAETSHQSFES